MKSVNISKNNQTKKISDYLTKNKNICSGDGIDISYFSDLIKEIAELSFLNQDHMLFYRGQSFDFQNSTNTSSSFYPSIYRERTDKKGKNINLRVRTLNKASELLIEEIKKNDVVGKEEIIKKKYVQWSILQHYGVCETPLLDLTHSLRVACSFALEKNCNEYGYIYVFAMPYVTHRISTNSEQETIVIRLLSISPPQALRPYYQEGYLVGTEFITEDFNDKQELDFGRRLIAKYRIKNISSFWDQDTSKIPSKILYPEDDELFLNISKTIQEKLSIIDFSNNEFAEEFGKFMLKWIEIENHLKKIGVMKKSRVYHKIDAINTHLYEKIKKIHVFKKNLVRMPSVVSINDLRMYNIDIQEIVYELNKMI